MAGLVTLALASAVIVTTPDSAGAASPVPRRSLVYIASSNVDEQVVVLNARGTRRHRLTTGPSWGETPRWSPRGKRILYLRRAPNDVHFPDLMVMGARGRHKQRLLAGGHRYFISDLAWGPAGRRVALVIAGKNGYSEIHLLSLRTHKLTRLHAGVVPSRDPSTLDWSPDGRTIAFSALGSTPDGQMQTDHDLFLIRPDGSGLRRLTSTPGRDEFNPRWSPNSRQLVYSNWTSKGCQLSVFVSSGDGTHARRVPAGCDAQKATWAPNGRGLLVQKYGRGNIDVIWAMALDGSHRRFITRGGDASWRPR